MGKGYKWRGECVYRGYKTLGGIVPTIQTFRQLRTYQSAMDAAVEIFETTKTFPKTETYSMTDQIRRSSRAVGALIAEAWGRRRYHDAFINVLSQAQAEALETQSWLEHALRCEYLEQEDFKRLDREWSKVGGMLQRMMDRAATFTLKPDRSTSNLQPPTSNLQPLTSKK